MIHLDNGLIYKFENACDNNDLDLIKKYIVMYPELMEYNNGELFEYAMINGNADILKIFVDNGCDVNVDNSYLLYYCARNKYDDCVNILMNNGAMLDNIKNTKEYKYIKNLNAL